MAGKGGFLRPIRLGPWMQENLSDGHITWAFQIYREYREALGAAYEARGQKRTKRRGASYHTIRNYLFMLRKLGWIEYVGSDPMGEERSGGRFKAIELVDIPAGRLLFRITSAGSGADWSDITASYKEEF